MNGSAVSVTTMYDENMMIIKPLSIHAACNSLFFICIQQRCMYLFIFILLTAHLHYSPLDKYHCDGLELMDDAMTYAFVHVVLVDLLEARGEEGAFCLTHQ